MPAKVKKGRHTLECDLLFAAFQSYCVERGDRCPDHAAPRECACEGSAPSSKSKKGKVRAP